MITRYHIQAKLLKDDKNNKDIDMCKNYPWNNDSTSLHNFTLRIIGSLVIPIKKRNYG